MAKSINPRFINPGFLIPSNFLILWGWIPPEGRNSYKFLSTVANSSTSGRFVWKQHWLCRKAPSLETTHAMPMSTPPLNGSILNPWPWYVHPAQCSCTPWKHFQVVGPRPCWKGQSYRDEMRLCETSYEISKCLKEAEVSMWTPKNQQPTISQVLLRHNVYHDQWSTLFNGRLHPPWNTTCSSCCPECWVRLSAHLNPEPNQLIIYGQSYLISTNYIQLPLFNFNLSSLP